jgi:colanic acid/amylovoran biosynthesis glycosyltransferase
MILKNRKIALITTGSFPELNDACFIKRYCKIIEKGVNLTLFGRGKGDWSLFPKSQKIIAHKKLPGNKLFSIILGFLFYLFSAFVKSPKRTIIILKRFYKSNDFSIKSLPALRIILFFFKNHYDIIHFEFGQIGKSFQYLIEFKDMLNTKFIQSFRGYDILIRPLVEGRDMYNFIFKHCDYFHFLSELLLKGAIDLGYNKDNFTIIPPPVDTDFFKASNNKKRNKKTILISVARLHWKKGHEYSLQAMKIIKNKGLKFVFYIIGDGPHKDAILHEIHALHLEDCVKLTGEKRREEVKKYLEIADIFILSSISEGFGNAPLEASAMELPCVVSTEVGGEPESVINERTGFVIPARDPRTLAEKIKILIKNPKLRLKMGKEAREHVIKNYILEKQTENQIRMYKKILNLKSNDTQK